MTVGRAACLLVPDLPLAAVGGQDDNLGRLVDALTLTLVRPAVAAAYGISALPAIVEAVQGEAEIFVDGGFYRGTDILKAIALGANCVGIGRLEAWALAAGGVPALLRCLTLLKRELTKSMALAGVTTLADLNPAFVTQAAAVATPDVVSAFPLIDDYPGPPGIREGTKEGKHEGNHK